MQESLMWVKHGAAYLLNLYTVDSTTGEGRLVGLFGQSAAMVNGQMEEIDFAYFGPPEEYTTYAPHNLDRPSFYCTTLKPCTDIAADTSAALAAASLALHPSDPVFARKCLQQAETIHAFASKNLGSYMNETVFPEVGWKTYREWYPSSGYRDELLLSCVWICSARGEGCGAYLEEANKWAEGTWPSEYSWADKSPAAFILLHRLSPSLETNSAITSYFSTLLPGGPIPRTARGLLYLFKWGSLRYACNAAFLGMVWGRELEKEGDAEGARRVRTMAVQQGNYVLGDAGRSWVVGFGDGWPRSPYHKSSYNSWIDWPMRGQPSSDQLTDFLYSPTPNRHILYGALVGGPELNDSYVDNRNDYVYTEVTQDYNAAFQGLMGALVQYYGAGTVERGSDCGLELGWEHPNAKRDRKPVWGKGDCYHGCGECPKDKKLWYQPPGYEGTGTGLSNDDAKTNRVSTNAAGRRIVGEGFFIILDGVSLFVLRCGKKF
ncbi:hypothetical protein HK097_001459 [Rhizophlyctis rosea]|uniref:Endoglucanase n=1 Tax=Rhizophlyctis rosea TaxID=64517 RepID=A0AAD5S4C2_9FUNG|nr:hypothetical protein HK097_001459 [Rhizophlyctis rosea]